MVRYVSISLKCYIPPCSEVRYTVRTMNKGDKITMAATEPIRDKKQLKALGEYFLQRGQLRNYVMVVLGVSTVLRISDLLRLKWEDVYDENRKVFQTHVVVTEHKTGKTRKIALNKQALHALRLYLPHRRGVFIFTSNRRDDRAISRVQAWRIIRTAVEAVGISGKIACHSLRKTFGYHAWISSKVSPVVIMEIFNHRNYETTRSYLGIRQDELDEVYLKMELF